MAGRYVVHYSTCNDSHTFANYCLPCYFILFKILHYISKICAEYNFANFLNIFLNFITSYLFSNISTVTMSPIQNNILKINSLLILFHFLSWVTPSAIIFFLTPSIKTFNNKSKTTPKCIFFYYLKSTRLNDTYDLCSTSQKW